MLGMPSGQDSQRETELMAISTVHIVVQNCIQSLTARKRGVVHPAALIFAVATAGSLDITLMPAHIMRAVPAVAI